MDIKLKNNSLLSLGSTINTVITDNCTSIYVNNCPNVLGIAILRQCSSLTRVRLDIGNVSGSFSELMQYSTLAGFNDNYEPQTKPRLVGTWTVNDWYTTAQLEQAQAVFDGLTIVGDPNYVLDFSQMAVQVLDPNEDNYNPAVAIILQGHNLGNTMTTAPLGHGRWFLTKAQAAAINDIGGWFSRITTVTDANGIVSSNTTLTYRFEDFLEFEYFGVTSIGDGIFSNKGFNNSTLKSIIIPSSVTRIAMTDNPNGNAAFKACNFLESIIFKTTSFRLANASIFAGCSKLKSIDLSGCISDVISNDTFNGCSDLESIVLPPTLSSIGHRAFYGCTNLKISFIIPSTVTSLGGAFCATFNSSGIKELIIENGLTSWTSTYNGQVGYSLCGNCYQLEKVVLPASLTIIRVLSFANCPKLKDVICHATTPPTLESTNVFSNNTNLKIYVGDGSSAAHDDAILADYLADSNWATYSARLDTWYNYLHPTT